MAGRIPSSSVSVRIGRLVLPPGQPGGALGDSIAEALARELAGSGPPGAGQLKIAEAIARGIAHHPAFPATGASAGGQD